MAHAALTPASTAIALIAANRPSYFQKTVQSLARNHEAARRDIYLFLDYTTEEMERLHREILAEAGLSGAKVLTRGSNIGCGRNIIGARRHLFDDLGYHHAFIFEDDLVISSEYVRLCEKAMQWGEDEYDNVGAVQGWSECRMTREEKLNSLDRIEGTHCNFWGYLLSKRCWDTIRDTLYLYEKLYLRDDYSLRPHAKIKEWALAHLSAAKPPARANPFPSTPRYIASRERYFARLPAGQDGITAMALEANGWIRLCTSVNRAQAIGESGIHMTPHRFVNEFRYHEISLEEFASDGTRTQFFPAID